MEVLIALLLIAVAIFLFVFMIYFIGWIILAAVGLFTERGEKKSAI